MAALPDTSNGSSTRLDTAVPLYSSNDRRSGQQEAAGAGERVGAVKRPYSVWIVWSRGVIRNYTVPGVDGVPNLCTAFLHKIGF